MKNCERIFDNDKFIGLVHEAKGKWYVTMPYGFRNLFTSYFRTCGNGIVRKSIIRENMCSDAMTWDTKEAAIDFMRYIYNDPFERKASKTL